MIKGVVTKAGEGRMSRVKAGDIVYIKDVKVSFDDDLLTKDVYNREGVRLGSSFALTGEDKAIHLL